jgi:hypothetical protein
VVLDLSSLYWIHLVEVVVSVEFVFLWILYHCSDCPIHSLVTVLEFGVQGPSCQRRLYHLSKFSELVRYKFNKFTNPQLNIYFVSRRQ